MRVIFTDGFNSLSHFIFGMLGVYCWPILPLYIIYQYMDINETNVRIDLVEFFIGYMVCLMCIQLELISDNKNLFVLKF
jgi:hypothetical protein